MINPKIGEWSYDIPFIWDCLTLSRNEGIVYVDLSKDFCYLPNDDSTSYAHKGLGYNDIEVGRIFRIWNVNASKRGL